MEIGDGPRYTLAEIYDIVATKFGVTAAQLFGKAKNSSDPMNTARNVAGMVAIADGHDRFEIAFYTKRSETVIHGLSHKAYKQPLRCRLAWGIWHELGGSWDAFEKRLRLVPPAADVNQVPPHVEILPIPGEDEYIIPGVSRAGAEDKATPILKYFTRNMDLSPDLVRHLGLSYQHLQGDQQLYSHLLKTAVTDYLLGEDAKAWIGAEEQSNDDGISFSDACTMLGLDPAAMRRKLAKIADLVACSREAVKEGVAMSRDPEPEVA